MVQLRAKGLGGDKPRRIARRGEVRGFSYGSRGRLLRKVGSLDKNKLALPIFMTLTYPKTWPGDWRRWKKDLDAFRHAFERKYPNVPVVWRLELQKRGAPHYHLLVFQWPLVDFQWLRDVWTRIVTGRLTGARRLRVRVERVRSWRGVMWYCSKYFAKVSDESVERSPMGRHWGVWRESLLGVITESIMVSLEEFQELRWRVMEHLRAKGRDVDFRYGWAGIWAFVPYHEMLDMIGAVIGRDLGAILSSGGVT